MIILLQKWDSRDALTPEFQEFDVTFKKWRPIHRDEINREIKIQGWFSKFPEGIFASFEVEYDVYFYWNSLIYVFKDGDSVKWRSAITGRTFNIYRNSCLMFEARYMTLKRFILSPWKIFEDLLLPDDDWGLENDLPSFVHSIFLSGQKNFHNAIKKWNKERLNKY